MPKKKAIKQKEEPVAQYRGYKIYQRGDHFYCDDWSKIGFSFIEMIEDAIDKYTAPGAVFSGKIILRSTIKENDKMTDGDFEELDRLLAKLGKHLGHRFAIGQTLLDPWHVAIFYNEKGAGYGLKRQDFGPSIKICVNKILLP